MTERIAVTGAYGFLGWHVCCRMLATRGTEPVRLGRDDFESDERLAAALRGVDTVIHIAGVNRASSDEAVETGNVVLAQRLAAAVGGDTHIVFANSVQADSDTPYGRGKRQAAEILAASGATLADVLLPNLFGEHGKPGYNSFVATFAHEIANGRQPEVSNDRAIPLLHAQQAAEVLLACAADRANAQIRPVGESHGITEVRDLLNEFHESYAKTGEIPDISTPFRLDLFNTYRSAIWPDAYPIHPQVHADARGELIETFRAHGPAGQGYVSSTRPGQVRGDHYHLRKVERFVVFRGQAEISLRRLFSSDIVRFTVSGECPAIIDMPTMWVHNIRNIGSEDVITAFWADQILDPKNPDQYPMMVGKE